VTDAVRVLVADDEATVRDGLVALLGLLPGIQVVAAAADGNSVLTLIAEHSPTWS
jgi:YesN/AraC family two-component response regulator